MACRRAHAWARACCTHTRRAAGRRSRQRSRSCTLHVRAGQAVFTAPLAGADLAPAAPLLERYWGARALAPPLLARQARLKVVFAVRPRGGGSGPRPVETELHLPHQLQAAVGAPCART